MVGYQQLRETVPDPLVDFADQARRLATELEQFGSDIDAQKGILSTVWAGIDAVAAMTSLAEHSDEYRRVSTAFREVDDIVINLANGVKAARQVLESAIAMVPSIPGSISANGTITINYAALGPNPAPAAVAAAQQRAQEVHGHLTQAIRMATESDQAAQSALARLLGGDTTGTQTLSTETATGEPADTTTPADGATEPGDTAPDDATGGQDDTGTPVPPPTGTVPGTGGDGATGDGSGSGGSGSGGSGSGSGSGQQGSGDGSGDKPKPSGERSDRELWGDILDGLGQAISGQDGVGTGERSDMQIIGDIIEAVGEALAGDEAGGTPPDATIPPPTTIPAPEPTTPGTGDPAPGGGQPGGGDGAPAPEPGTGTPGGGDGGQGGQPGGGDGAPAPEPGTGTPGGGDGGQGGQPGDGGSGGDSPGGGDSGGDGDGDGSGEPAPGDGVVPPVGDLSQAQMNNAVRIIEIGEQLGISEKGQAIALATAMQESSFRNLANDSVPASLGIPNEGVGSDHDSVGMFQQRPSQGWGTVEQCMDVEYATTKFYTELLRVDGWENMSIAEAAQTVQVSAHPDAYARWEGLAYDILEQVD
ncbi:hypothetical protein LX16_0591 [Stackebrandtia albiflava]|uniref:Uncharacterized protein n=1 Tax=Stackebrandtia albiflava TaxID=406432 RepID=A0A562VAM3_9ACTN|nr:hypothetical protein [Stackebrandtia albiflava]TWJ14898.1 hypothetical protein LX16_0591 [Stackebrandtia albiflava]